VFELCGNQREARIVRSQLDTIAAAPAPYETYQPQPYAPPQPYDVEWQGPTGPPQNDHPFY
jgi:hypothetical protein